MGKGEGRERGGLAGVGRMGTSAAVAFESHAATAVLMLLSSMTVGV